MSIRCPYCDTEAAIATGAEIYPHRDDLRHLTFWLCRDCDAYVGCHKGSHKPLGRLANKELRRAKILAHASFDPLWRNGSMSRNGAYRWLAEKMGLRIKQCHIGMFDVDQCKRVVQIVGAPSSADQEFTPYERT